MKRANLSSKNKKYLNLVDMGEEKFGKISLPLPRNLSLKTSIGLGIEAFLAGGKLKLIKPWQSIVPIKLNSLKKDLKKNGVLFKNRKLKHILYKNKNLAKLNLMFFLDRVNGFLSCSLTQGNGSALYKNNKVICSLISNGEFSPITNTKGILGLGEIYKDVASPPRKCPKLIDETKSRLYIKGFASQPSPKGLWDWSHYSSAFVETPSLLERGKEGGWLTGEKSVFIRPKNSVFIRSTAYSKIDRDIDSPNNKKMKGLVSYNKNLFKKLLVFLKLIFNKEIELDLTRIKNPYNDSHILNQILGEVIKYKSKSSSFYRLTQIIKENANIRAGLFGQRKGNNCIPEQDKSLPPIGLGPKPHAVSPYGRVKASYLYTGIETGSKLRKPGAYIYIKNPGTSIDFKKD